MKSRQRISTTIIEVVDHKCSNKIAQEHIVHTDQEKLVEKTTVADLNLHHNQQFGAV